MTRILFLGDSAGTGFGTVTRDLGAALLARGEDVRFVSLNEVPGGELDEPFVGRTAIIGTDEGWLARPHDTDSAELFMERVQRLFTGGAFEDGWTPEAAIVLGDMGSLKVSPVLGLIPDGFPAFHYVPVEGVWLPPAWGLIWKKVRPVAVCRFGAEEIAKVTGTVPPFVYHGVDTDAFHPVSPTRPLVMRLPKGLAVLRTKEECRRFLGWPLDEFILFRADRHMPRKEYPALFRATAPFLARHAKARLIVHALERDEGGDFDDDLSHFGPVTGVRLCRNPKHQPHLAFGGVAARMQITDTGGAVDRKVLCAMYNAADLYVSNCAEGFGLAIAESLACGTPALGLAYSSVPEVIGPAGRLVPAANPLDNIYSHLWAHVDEGAFTQALEDAIADRRALAMLGLRGPAHVREHFSWTQAAEQFAALVADALRVEVAA